MRLTGMGARNRSAAPGVFAQMVHRGLEQLERGSLTIVEDDVETRYGQGAPSARVRVLNPRFYRRLGLGGSVGAGEAYMDGDWECDDLVAVVRLMIANRDALSRLEGAATWIVKLKNLFEQLTRRNSRRGSRRNVTAHYDLSNAFFETFLDARMMYSSAVFDAPDMSLEQASAAKLERLCRKLELTPEDHLLEIGGGWGGLAVYAASRFGCRVTTTTISPAQHEAAVDRVHQAGLEDRIDVLLTDYRDLEGVYDKLVSVEMVEAVGDAFLHDYFTALNGLVRPEGLIALQAITIEDHRYRETLRSVGFIRKHVFPGSFIPCISRLLSAAAGAGDAVLVSLEDIGADYARTLAEWRRRTELRHDEIAALGFDDRFRRMWRFYLCYCEGGFRERAISDVQLLFAKPGYRGQPWRAKPATSPIAADHIGVGARGAL